MDPGPQYKKYSIGDLVIVKIEKIVPRGFGLAFAEKLTIFVPLSAPGDEVTVRLTQIKKRTAFAEVVEIIKAGQGRVDPQCVYFGACGGCNFQQLNYEEQLRAKVDIINDCLERIGKIRLERYLSIIPSPREYDYRGRVRWQIDSKTQRFGYFRRDSHEVVDVEGCPVLSPPLAGLLRDIRATMDWTHFRNSAEVVAACGDDSDVSVRSSVGLESSKEISFTVSGENYAFSSESFFQANHLLIGSLIEAATSGAEGPTALDLYAGVGLFTLPLARKFESVIAVETDPTALKFARMNIENAGLQNVQVMRGEVGRYMEGAKKADFVLIDPPRTGTERGVIESIAMLEPANISYVSCEPSILARDLRILVDRGYVIEAIKALDLFPQTHHVETVVRMRRT